jgi:lipopolysaccharide/colanic/teichoic acid biosynthesis glycosyltransferase
MVTKLLESVDASIEDGIYASFGKVAISSNQMVKRKAWYSVGKLWQRMVKRLLDISGSVFLMAAAAPAMLLVGLLIKITSRGPVFFRQERVGYQGKIFRIWKFRTMKYSDSETEHRQYIRYLLKEGEKAKGQLELLTRYINFIDKSITPIGRLLRISSLDELPQLINILMGHMSFVGPRPHPIYEVEEYKTWYRRRLNVKPGLTGWSKINLRCTPRNYEEAILYDLWYVDHWNVGLDLKILLRTIPYVFSMKDAH